MNTDNILFKLLKFIILGIGLLSFLNILTSKYSIFNYFHQKGKVSTLTTLLKEKEFEKQKLLNEVEILRNDSVINIDILEKETIKKLNKIPADYKIIIE